MPMVSVSRIQHWKFHVSPTMAATVPVGWGRVVQSTAPEIIPVLPVLAMPPATLRPIEPARQRLPALPAGLVTKPWVSLVMKTVSYTHLTLPTILLV